MDPVELKVYPDMQQPFADAGYLLNPLLHDAHIFAMLHLQFIVDGQFTQPNPSVELQENPILQHPAALLPSRVDPQSEHTPATSHKVQLSAAGQLIQDELNSLQVYSGWQQPEARFG